MFFLLIKKKNTIYSAHTVVIMEPSLKSKVWSQRKATACSLSDKAILKLKLNLERGSDVMKPTLHLQKFPF
jgi:hypothetical protein